MSEHAQRQKEGKSNQLIGMKNYRIKYRQNKLLLNNKLHRIEYYLI